MAKIQEKSGAPYNSLPLSVCCACLNNGDQSICHSANVLKDLVQHYILLCIFRLQCRKIPCAPPSMSINAILKHQPRVLKVALRNVVISSANDLQNVLEHYSHWKLGCEWKTPSMMHVVFLKLEVVKIVQKECQCDGCMHGRNVIWRGCWNCFSLPRSNTHWHKEEHQALLSVSILKQHINCVCVCVGGFFMETFLGPQEETFFFLCKCESQKKSVWLLHFSWRYTRGYL